MNKNRSIFSVWYWLGICLAGMMIYACARRGYPEGGPKDATPPVVIAEEPVSFTRNFDKKRVNVYFDEFVQLKNVEEKFVISPPQKKKPKVRTKGKYIQVEFLDTLRPNTTYNLDFADAIVDYNEGNPLGYYRYVFSTGAEIDSLELSGNVVNAESGEPVLNVYVMLYENQNDSTPLLQVPNYVARTDSSGFFRITNLRDTSYRIIAVEDNNRDYKYTPEGEMVAFLDSVIHPIVMPLVRTDTFKVIEKIVGQDTITSDSIVTRDLLAYGPNNLYLRLFMENLTQLYLVNSDRKERERLDFIFSIPGENDFKIELWDTLATQPFPENWYITERSAGNDTLHLWITDSTIYKRDTLNTILTYLRTDSTGRYVSYADTTRFTAKKEKTVERKGRKKDQPEKPKIEFLDIKPNISSELDLNGRLWLDFDKPIDKNGLKNIRLLQKVDTLYQPVDFRLVEDSLQIRRVYIDTKWEAEHEYQLQIDSAMITSIYGRHNNKLDKKFKVRSLEYYGKVMLDLKNVSGPVLVQMYKADNGKSENGKRKYNVLQQKSTDQDGVVTFDFIPEGKYKFRVVQDRNKNGKWDTGLYLRGLQPEEVVYLPTEINVKKNFDIEQEFDLKKKYREDVEEENK